MNPQTVLRALKTPVTLIVLALFVAWVAKWGYNEATKPLPSAAPSPCVVQEVGEQLPTDKVYVRVFNGTEKSGLAKRMAAILRADGFIVYKTTNTTEAIWRDSVVVGYSEDSPEVVLVRQAFDGIAFRADGRPDHSVDVIIGHNQPVVVDSPKFNAPLEDGTACIPSIQVVDSSQ